MTRYKRSNLESFSEVKMGKCLRICKIWHQILEEFHNNFPQSQTAKALNTSSTENLEKSLCATDKLKMNNTCQ